MGRCFHISESSPAGRDETIDTAKGIGIVLVFLGHLVLYDSPAFRMIFNVHMPLFFFLSGRVFNPETRPNLTAFVRKAAAGLLLPLGLFACLGLLVAVLSGTLLPTHGTLLSWCANLWHGTPSFVPSSWFIFCLFLTQALFWTVSHRAADRNPQVLISLTCVLMLVLFDLLSFLSLRAKMLFPLASSAVPGAFVFFSLGCLTRRIDLFRPAFVLGLLPLILLARSYPSPNLALPEVSSLAIFLLCSIGGILALTALSRIVNNPVLRFVGRHSLAFFLLEGHVAALVRHFGRRFDPSLSSDPMTVPLGGWTAILVFLLLQLGLCALFAPLATRAIDGLRRRLFP